MTHGRLKTVQITRRFTDLAWGGTETVVLETSRCLQQLGHGAEILTTTAMDATRHSSMAGVEVERFPYFYPWIGLRPQERRRLDERGGNLFSISLGRALARRDLDLIHLHTGKRLGGIGRTVARLRDVPYIVSLHGGLLDVPRQEADRWAPKNSGLLPFEWGKALGFLVGSRRVLDDAAAILCVNPAEQAMLQKRFPHQRVEWMPNGVDTTSFGTGNGADFRRRFRIPGRRRLLTVVGRIDAQKNQELALEILARLSHDARFGEAGWHLALIGPTTDTEYARELDRSIARSGLGDRVTWVPGLAPGSQELIDAYHASRYVLVPSIHEPFGIVVLEAWAAGKTVLASRVGGLAGLVRDGVDGSLLESSDAVAWARRIGQLEARPQQARSMAGAGQRRARAFFDWSRITERLVELYRQVRRAHSPTQL